jgi:hypothetical protein
MRRRWSGMRGLGDEAYRSALLLTALACSDEVNSQDELLLTLALDLVA